jgi:predicted ArsR family transcriptional regulator
MKTTDLFKSNRSAKRLNESLEKTFGTKINFQDFDTPKLEDARNKLRTQIHDARSQSGFNETIENETLTKAQWMHDAIVSELAEREEYIVDTTTDENYESMWADADIEEGSGIDRKELMDILKRFDENMNEIGGYGDPDFDKILAALNQGDVESAVEEVYGNYSDQDGGELRNMDDYIEDLEYEFKDLAGVSDGDEGGETDDGYALASAGFGSDEDYESVNNEVSLGDYSKKAAMSKAMAQTNRFFDRDDPEAVAAADKTIANRERGMARADARRKPYTPPPVDQEKQRQDLADKYPNIDELVRKAELRRDPDYEMADGQAYYDGRDAEQNYQKLKQIQSMIRSTQEMNTNEAYINNAKDAVNILADIRAQSKLASRGEADPVRPNQLVNDLYDVMQWIEANMEGSIETESVENSGENMTKLREGEIQQASAIVTAKTMVDRVGRWIEELSGMENDTLLQLGDSIRDEMGQEQAKAFIEAVAPAIQQALETLKGTRDTLSTGVRSLASGEQPADMLGAEPTDMGGDEMAAEPDAMNMGDEMGGEDEFAAAEPAAGGIGDAGREQRESINRSSSLLKVLAG